MGRSKAVLDAAAFLNSISFQFGYDEIITTPSVADEVRTRAAVVDALIEEGKLRISKPKSETVERVTRVAEKMGEIGKLSKADIEVLALALQEGAILVTDDFHVQNVAAELGIPFQGVTGEIRERRTWVKRCSRCGKTYPPTYRGRFCKICGGKLVYFSK